LSDLVEWPLLLAYSSGIHAKTFGINKRNKIMDARLQTTGQVCHQVCSQQKGAEFDVLHCHC